MVTGSQVATIYLRDRMSDYYQAGFSNDYYPDSHFSETGITLGTLTEYDSNILTSYSDVIDYQL